MTDPIAPAIAVLTNYGILGLWTSSLIIEKWTSAKSMREALRELSNLIREKIN